MLEWVMIDGFELLEVALAYLNDGDRQEELTITFTKEQYCKVIAMYVAGCGVLSLQEQGEFGLDDTLELLLGGVSDGRLFQWMKAGMAQTPPTK